MKYLILSLFIVLSGCKSEKQKFYEETGIYLSDEPEFADLNDLHICDSYTKKIDNNERLIACYNTALRKKMDLYDLRLKYPELSPSKKNIYGYLHYGIRTCFNTLFKKDSIKYFCNDFEKYYENYCTFDSYQNECYLLLSSYKLKNDN